MTYGPKPKPAHQRRRSAIPVGELPTPDLPPLQKPVLPPLPKRDRGTGPWPGATRRAWAAWRRDPITARYSPTNVEEAVDLARLHARMVVTDSTKLATEVRLRMDRLGLTPHGRRRLLLTLGEIGRAAGAAPRLPGSRPTRDQRVERLVRLRSDLEPGWSPDREWAAEVVRRNDELPPRRERRQDEEVS